jgi:tryptophan synthase alpha chain
MNPIDERFANLRSAGKKAFIPFVTAGDPDIVTTAAAVRELDASGSHLIEIGFPFSDLSTVG